MILSTKKLEKPVQVIVILKSTLPGVYSVYNYNAEDFYLRYYASGKPGGGKHALEDVVDTFCNSNDNKCGYTKEQLMEYSTIEIISDMIVHYVEKA